MQAVGLDPETETPTYSWMVENGFSGVIKTLRRDHDLTLQEFYDEINAGDDADDYWGSTMSSSPSWSAMHRNSCAFSRE